MKKSRAVWKVIKYGDVLRAFTMAERISTASHLLKYSKSTVNRIIKEFEEMGLMERSRGEARLTEKGFEVLKILESLKELIGHEVAHANCIVLTR